MLIASLRALLVALVVCAAGVLAVPAASDTTHDLSATYDLTRSDDGGYSIEPPNLFTPKHPRDLAATGPAQVPQNPPRFDHTCPLDKQQTIIDALTVSREYLTAAINYLRSQGAKPKYGLWFGADDHRRAAIVLSTLMRLRDNELVRSRFACNCRDTLWPSWFDPEAKVLRLCTPFWHSLPRGRYPSQGLILAKSAMYRYGPHIISAAGPESCGLLARNNPEEAIRNAPNYMEFIRTVNNLPRGASFGAYLFD